MLHQDRAESSFELALGLWSCLLRRDVAMLKLERCRQAKLHPRIRQRPMADDGSAPSDGLSRLVGRCAWESDSPESARFVSRLQKLVRRIFLVGTAG